MRLTLRTLLAYLDGTLEPEDSEILDRKAKESEHVQHLVTRMIAAAKDPQLGVYALRGDRQAPDLNEVARYLDNTLATERVLDLEQSCLTSDRALAEVSSCHKILCRIITQPAQLERDLLRQAYALDVSPAGSPESKVPLFRRLLSWKAHTRELPRSRRAPHDLPIPVPPPPNSPREPQPAVEVPRTPGAADAEPSPGVDQETNRAKSVAMKRIFISHSSKDREFVEKHLIKVLKEVPALPWYSRDDIRTGTHWERSIVKALRECDWFLLVMSPNSAQSEWVRDEVHWAINNRFGAMIPVILEECDPYDFHIRLDRIQAVNFALDQQEAFHRIVAILSASEHTESPQ